MNVFEEFNQLLLQIKDNQLVQSIAPWASSSSEEICWSESANERFSWTFSFEPPHRIIINRGRFLKNGVEILIRPEQVIVANNGATFSGIVATNWPSGI
jgi:hypothetical protein